MGSVGQFTQPITTLLPMSPAFTFSHTFNSTVFLRRHCIRTAIKLMNIFREAGAPCHGRAAGVAAKCIASLARLASHATSSRPRLSPRPPRTPLIMFYLCLLVSLFYSLSHSLTISYSPPQSEFQFHICSHFQSPCSFPSLCPPSTLPQPPLLPLPLPLPLTLTFLLILLPFLPLLLPSLSLHPA